MSMTTVDVGGASRGGRPILPPMQTIETTPDGFLIRSEKSFEYSQNEQIAAAATQEEINRAAQTSPMGAKPVYPKDHPANRPDLEVSKSESGNMAVKLEGSQTSYAGPQVLGDVRKGYVTGSLVGKPAVPNVIQSDTATSSTELNQLTAANAALLAALERGAPLPAVEQVKKEEPKIEVAYSTPYGTFSCYYHKVRQSGVWLVMVSDANCPARNKFAPKPFKVQDPTDPEKLVHGSYDITVTGEDKRESKMKVVPIGIQFSLDNYDFVVLMVEEEAPAVPNLMG